MVPVEQRPSIDSIKTGVDFQQWYWLKEELMAYCRAHKIGTSGRKQELLARIVQYLDEGEVDETPKKKVKSSFDWGNAELTLSTRITDNYRNSQNMRKFMITNAGDHFSFSNEFMQWLRDNSGKTLGDALVFWVELDRKK